VAQNLIYIQKSEELFLETVVFVKKNINNVKLAKFINF
jgi:hypothetical protein